MVTPSTLLIMGNGVLIWISGTSVSLPNSGSSPNKPPALFIVVKDPAERVFDAVLFEEFSSEVSPPLYGPEREDARLDIPTLFPRIEPEKEYFANRLQLLDSFNLPLKVETKERPCPWSMETFFPSISNKKWSSKSILR